MTKRRAHLYFGTIIGAIGIAVMLIELVLHWRNPDGYRVGWATVAIGGSLFFFGWYITRPKSAEGGLRLWLSAGQTLGGILTTVRAGRRASDVAVVASPAPILPVDTQDGDLDNPPHLGAAPELPHIPETKP